MEPRAQGVFEYHTMDYASQLITVESKKISFAPAEIRH